MQILVLVGLNQCPLHLQEINVSFDKKSSSGLLYAYCRVLTMALIGELRVKGQSLERPTGSIKGVWQITEKVALMCIQIQPCTYKD